MIKHLEQSLIEDKYSRKEIRQLVINDICMSDKTFENKFNNLIQAIINFGKGEYYPSKMKRVYEFKRIDPKKVAAEITIAILFAEETTIQAIAAQVLNNLVDIEGNKFCELDTDIFTAIRTVAEVIYAGSKSGIYSMEKANEESCIMVYADMVLEDTTWNLIQTTQYLPPMIVEPSLVTNNRGSGYINNTTDSLILGKGNHHYNTINLDVINKMNKVAFSLDKRILDLEEISSKPLDTIDKKEAFNDLVKSSTKTYTFLLEKDNKFYFTHKIDKRGRFYSQGYHVNYQGNSYRKAMLVLNNTEKVNETI